MKTLNKLIIISLFASHNAFADITGAGDAAIVAQLVTQTQKIVDQVKTAKKALDISQYMEEVTELQQLKQLSETGSQFGELLSGIDSVDDGSWGSDPFGLKKVTSEIDKLTQEIEYANNKGDLEKAKRYSKILKNLKNIQFLSKANQQSQSTVASGANELDLTRVTAETSLVMSTLLQNKEQRDIEEQLRKEKQGDIAKEFISESMTYSASGN